MDADREVSEIDMNLAITPFEETIDVVPPVDDLSMNVTHFALDTEVDPLALNYSMNISAVPPELVA